MLALSTSREQPDCIMPAFKHRHAELSIPTAKLPAQQREPKSHAAIINLRGITAAQTYVPTYGGRPFVLGSRSGDFNPPDPEIQTANPT